MQGYYKCSQIQIIFKYEKNSVGVQRNLNRSYIVAIIDFIYFVINQ